MNTLLVAIDLDASSKAALQVARAQARVGDARVLVLHVVTAAVAGSAPALALRAAAMGVDPDELALTEARRNLDRFLAASGAKADHEQIRLEVGSPGDVILTVANEVTASCIVLGTHGRGRLGHAILGSVAHDVMTRARCTVIAVHEPDAASD